MIKNATGKEPIYIGKPEPTMVNIVRENYGCRAEETVVVGDRLYTDIATGLNAGVATICVLTGEATEDEVKNGQIKPQYTFNSVKDVFQAMCADMVYLPGTQKVSSSQIKSDLSSRREKKRGGG